MPAAPVAGAAYLAHRAEHRASVATVRIERAAISAAHRQGAADDPCKHPGVLQVLKGLSRTGKGRGRGQVQGLDWRAADLAAGVAANGGRSLAGLRDATIIQVMSDALLRVSEAAALDVADVQRQVDGSGTVTVRSSKTDQEGRGHVRYRRAYHAALGSVAQRCWHHHRRGRCSARCSRMAPPSRGASASGQFVRLSPRAQRPRALPVACRGTRSGSTPPQSLAAAGAGLVELQGSGRLAGAHHAGALRAAPARGAVAKLRYQAAR